MTQPTEEPEAARSTLGVIVWILFGLTGVVYLLNPTVGLVEAIPDNLPIVGNLDEATATVLVLSALKYLTGIDLTGRTRRLLGRGKPKKT